MDCNVFVLIHHVEKVFMNHFLALATHKVMLQAGSQVLVLNLTLKFSCITNVHNTDSNLSNRIALNV